MKVKFSKTLSFVIATMLVVSMICSTSAQAISPRKYLCRLCGGECTLVTIPPFHGNVALPKGCEHGRHFEATKGTQWICDSCNSSNWASLTQGHYCEGNGGHYCWDGECSC